MKTIFPRIIDKIYSLLLNIFCILFPLFFLPINNQLELSKNTFLVISALFLLFLYLFRSFSLNQNHISYSPSFSLPLIMLSASYFISTSLSPYKFPSMITSLGFLSMVIIFHLIIGTANKKTITLSLLLSAFIAVIFLGINLLDKPLNLGLAPTPPIAPISEDLLISKPTTTSSIFSPLGSIFFLFLFLIGLTPIAIISLNKFSQKLTNIPTLLKALVASSVLVGAFISAVLIIPPLDGKNTNAPIILNFDHSFIIALNSLSSGFKNAAVGFGPENFVDAFALLKQKSINTTDLWLYRFTSSGTFFFQIASTLGLLGTLSFLILFLKIIVSLFKADKTRNAYVFSAFLISIMQFAVPYSITLIFLLIIILALTEDHPRQFNTHPAISLILTVPSLILLVLGLTSFDKIVKADFYLQKSLNLNPPISKEILSLQTQATVLNPYNSEYFTSLAKTKYSINNILANTDKKGNEEATKILIEDSVKDLAKAIDLNPSNSTNYAILAAIYRNNYTSIQNGETLTQLNYQKAIALDPANPRNYVDYGGFYYQLKDYKKAEENYRRATELKPNYTNAYYNLAYALAQQGSFQEALNMINKVLSQLTPGTTDFDKASADKKTLEEALKPKTTPISKTLEMTNSNLSSESGQQKKIIKISAEDLIKLATQSAQ